ncbi:MAG: hypothetical protein LQ342_002182 [Letrouitia transgressa]|nr:MAG: hypothetical protein LQ342_002182 [Letrouitia transgressa]
MPSPASSFHSEGESGSISRLSSRRPSLHDYTVPAYREAKPLPYELREHCTIYFEEGLYIPALNLLSSLLASGTATSLHPPTYLPPSQILALAATLSLHPTLTTRAKSEDRLHAANLALRYLRLVLKLVGPVNGNLRDAFTFWGLEISSRRGGSGRRRATGDGTTPNKDRFDNISTDMTDAESLWARAEDFWQVLGWALNCSLIHRKRWERWALFLELMLDVLEADWTQRASEALRRVEQCTEDQDPRKQCIITQYVSSESVSTGKERKILRAIFADGQAKSVGEFTEIWRNETKERKKETNLKKVEAKIDIEADNWGDYMHNKEESELEDGESNGSLSPPLEAVTSASSMPKTAAALGGMRSVALRLRLLALLSHVSAGLPNTFINLATLYDLYVEHIRHLPLSTFFLLTSHASLRYFTPAAASSLTQYMLRSLIAASAPLPFDDDLSQTVLEQSYLPFPANTMSIADNAKVSLCVESLVRLLNQHVGLVWSTELHEAVEHGISERESRAKKAAKGKSKTTGEEDKMWLRASAGRIRGILQMVKG